ncbi:hypothetical protein CMU66_05705 [Elizabethkingia anophelis]|uniref:TerB family tellurite resistance protein n=1 Tax=Elizabethkingia anophelis TaxID=1117645 RepID=A0AAU8V0Z6_9FLAO|nr:hypothetical protein [Elizabethkingia anophelis]AQX02074.1 hypothetical protein BBD32_11670 [Elizabethkingia anophelis]EQB93196.1 hypothetical protein C874_00330 [Elizabethkingia anophelis 502]MCT3699096.1 hypothetical protein [Elizabethkingia anophelis]MCT3735695.1 hypothetical protein [Elizabethkingia anophelis]MCT3900079.1 hypothetical protein [Elizabethkingia anophelis]
MNTQISENLKVHFLRLYQMALSDDDFSLAELKMLYKIAEERGVPAKSLDEILLSPVNTRNILPQTIEEKIAYLYDLVLMILSDGRIDINERIALEKYIRLFGFTEENISAIAEYLLEAVRNGKTKNDILHEIQN